VYLESIHSYTYKYTHILYEYTMYTRIHSISVLFGECDVERLGAGLAISRSRVWLRAAASRMQPWSSCSHMHVPLSPSSINVAPAQAGEVTRSGVRHRHNGASTYVLLLGLLAFVAAVRYGTTRVEWAQAVILILPSGVQITEGPDSGGRIALNFFLHAD